MLFFAKVFGHFTAFQNDFAALSITAERTYSSPLLAAIEQNAKPRSPLWAAAQTKMTAGKSVHT
jgi:hypothetical protein